MNKDYYQNYNKEYYQNNKEYYQNYNKRKVECECGCISNYGHLARHRQSKKHSKLKNKLNGILN